MATSGDLSLAIDSRACNTLRWQPQAVEQMPSTSRCTGGAVSYTHLDVYKRQSYVSAATSGQLSVVAALAPLSPAVGVVLAAGLLHENLDRVQLTGAGCAVLGGVLLCW